MTTNFIVFFVTGMAGIAGHWYKKWIEGSTTDTFKEYLASNRKYTFGSFLGVLSMVGGGYASVDVSASSCLMLFFACLGVDSTLNKDSSFDPRTNKYQYKDNIQINTKLTEIKQEATNDSIQNIIDSDSKL